jgi:hypothetical protein
LSECPARMLSMHPPLADEQRVVVYAHMDAFCRISS